jgi:aminoglycoside 6'-N-acetyltransferase I
MDKIVKIKEKHLEACSNLYVDVFNKAPWNDKWKFGTAYKRLKNIYISPNFIGIVYFKNDIVVGAIFGNCEQYYDCKHYYLKELYVSNKFQGRGIGTTLIENLYEKLKQVDVQSIYLFTSKDINEFYLKNKFEEFNNMIMMGKHF